MKMDSSSRRSENQWLKLRQDCEEWTRSGEGARVNHALSQIPTKDFPRHWRLSFAHLARRAGLILLGLRLLMPALKEDPTPEEQAEYGVLLQKNGSVREALSTLEKIDGTHFPEALLYRVFCLFNSWSYAEARPLLEAYVNAPTLADYPRTIGLVNLASTHLCLNDYAAAQTLLDKLISECQAKDYARLEGNCHELLAQVHIKDRNWSTAERALERAERLLANDFSLDRFFVRKWQAVIAAEKTQDPASLHELRRQALQLKHWESVREADLFLVKLTSDENLFRHIYFGTPFPSYRQRLRVECPQMPVPSELVLGTEGPLLDLITSQVDGEPVFKSGKKIHQLLCLLFLDFYRPRRQAQLFAELFPTENFNVFSSPNRVHQLIRRLRAGLHKEGLALNLREENGSYRVDLQDGVRVRLVQERLVESPEHAQLLQLRTHFAERPFSAREAREQLHMPLTSFHRVLKFGLEKGLLTQSGNGPKTRYKSVA